MHIIRNIKVSIIAGLVIGLAATGVWANQGKFGGQLVVGLNADIRGTDGIARDSNTDIVMNHILEGLVALREDLSVGPLLAESWDVSTDGTVYTFMLRDNLTFHNGKPVTANEVKWSWDRLLNPKSNWRGANYYNGKSGAKITSIEVLDKSHIRFHLEKPNPLFLTFMTDFQCLPGVLHPDSVKADGSWNTPIGTGPYQLEAWRQSEYVLLKRFQGYQPRKEPLDGYAGGRTPYLDSIKFMVTPEESVRKAALISGDVDVLPFLGSEHAEEIRAKGMNIQVAKGLPWVVLLVQTRDPLLSNVRFRKAIAHAIDLKQLAAASTQGMAGPNPSVVPESDPFHTSTHDQWPGYSIKKAKALLSEIGYKGEVVKIQANKKYHGMYKHAIIIQAMLTAAGINAQLEILDWATQLDNYLKGNFQLSSFAYSARLDPRLMYLKLVGSKDAKKTHQWENPQASVWVQEAVKETDPVKLQKIYDRLHTAMAKDLPIYGLYNDPVISAIRPNVKGFKPWSTNKPRFWRVWKE